MRTKLLFAALFFSAGCATTDNRQTTAVDPQIEAIRARASEFIALAAERNYAAMADFVVARDAAGFNGAVFVENRFRMKPNRFDVVAWDQSAIWVTAIKDGPGMLSTANVTVRMLTNDEVKRVYINLRWQKQGGQWRIDAYPQQ
jgi:hypothetical protein